MRAEVITVGTELLMGQTLDTHSQFLSLECAVLGIPVLFHTSVDDDPERLRTTIQNAHARSDLVIMCGGLGPTLDDLTKEILADFLGVTLVQDLKTLHTLESFFAGRSIAMTENNIKQTYVFPNGTVFHNPRGTAPGLAVSSEGVTYILLPGPPNEMRPMFHEQVRDFLISLIPDQKVILSHPLSFFGIGESLLEDRLSDLIMNQTNPAMATYAEEAGVVLRLTAKADTMQEAKALIAPIKAEVLSRVGQFCFSEKKETLEEVVVRLLIEQSKTVAMAESCTGGYVTHLMTTIPGSSQAVLGGFVSYTNRVKEQIVHVSKAVLDQYSAVSPETAQMMAEQTLAQFNSDYAISVTGNAGPEPSEGKAVGEVYIGVAVRGKSTEVHKYMLKGHRTRIQLLAAKYSLFLLWQRIKKG